VPKLKTNKRAKARFKVTGSGKIVRMKAHASHLRRKKPTKVKRQFSGTVQVSNADVPRIKTLILYRG
jgi:large subunit ribosomal protein L35